MNQSVTLMLFVLLSAGTTSWAQKQDKKQNPNSELEAAAADVAKTWLESIDKGKYAESWYQAAKAIQDKVTQSDWTNQVSTAREKLGNVVERKVVVKKFMTEIQGAPKGEYVVVQFHTKFKNRAKAIETVTPMKESDGNWRVSGYHIK